MNTSTGIASIGLHTPPLAMKLEELAKLRGIDVDKYHIGLGLREMSLCPQNYSVIDLAVDAAKAALANWDGRLEDIGLIAVGTETPVDHSRPLSAWVAERLGIKGYVRSYEVKHACYGGTLALKQAIEWYLVANPEKKAALVIAVDIALYEEGSVGEPTQGAGAVAMVIEEPKIASVSAESIAYSEPVFDFWKPLTKKYPEVNGQFSLECYKKAATACFHAFKKNNNLYALLNHYQALCFHVPFPKMVKKAFATVAEAFNFSEDNEKMYTQKIEPFMEWNKACGNSYTASLWLCVANCLAKLDPDEKLIAFSYGSGLGSELLTITNHCKPKNAYWYANFQTILKARTFINADDYVKLRRSYK